MARRGLAELLADQGRTGEALESAYAARVHYAALGAVADLARVDELIESLASPSKTGPSRTQ